MSSVGPATGHFESPREGNAVITPGSYVPDALIAALIEGAAASASQALDGNGRIAPSSEPMGVADGRIDKQKLIGATLDLYSRWGIIGELIRAGIVKSREALGASFELAKLSKTGIERLKGMSAASQMMPILVPPMDYERFSESRFVSAVFEGNRIPYFNVVSFNDAKKLDPAALQCLRGAFGKPHDQQIVAWRNAYCLVQESEKASIRQPEPARLIVTASIIDSHRKAKSATEDVEEALTVGTNFAGPAIDAIVKMIFFDRILRQYAEEQGINYDSLEQNDCMRLSGEGFSTGRIYGLLPKARQITRYPLYVLSNGDVPTHIWKPSLGKFCQGCASPATKGEPNSRVIVE